MNFNDKLQAHGRLEIIKIDKATGEEETLFDDHNVITGGLGRSIAQFMTVPYCIPKTKCPDLGPQFMNFTQLPLGSEGNPEDSVQQMVNKAEWVTNNPEGGAFTAAARSVGGATVTEGSLVDKCALPPYLLSHFQVGVGASSVTEASTVKLLGKPLTKEQYGPYGLISVNLDSHVIYSEEDIPLQKQSVIRYYAQGVVGSGITSVIVMDEETANGQLLNEIGLFVRNPFIRTKQSGAAGVPIPPVSLLGGSSPPVSHLSGPIPAEVEDPGSFLAAYRQYTPIKKQSFFSLLFRWTINFTQNCS
jgi:hypothetical protein